MYSAVFGAPIEIIGETGMPGHLSILSGYVSLSAGRGSNKKSLCHPFRPGTRNTTVYQISPGAYMGISIFAF